VPPNHYCLHKTDDVLDCIAHLTATDNDDWSVVLQLCEMASASAANAKEAVKALRLEFR
jgi:hypothetical protein